MGSGSVQQRCVWRGSGMWRRTAVNMIMKVLRLVMMTQKMPLTCKIFDGSNYLKKESICDK